MKRLESTKVCSVETAPKPVVQIVERKLEVPSSLLNCLDDPDTSEPWDGPSPSPP